MRAQAMLLSMLLTLAHWSTAAHRRAAVKKAGEAKCDNSVLKWIFYDYLMV